MSFNCSLGGQCCMNVAFPVTPNTSLVERLPVAPAIWIYQKLSLPGTTYFEIISSFAFQNFPSCERKLPNHEGSFPAWVESFLICGGSFSTCGVSVGLKAEILLQMPPKSMDDYWKLPMATKGNILRWGKNSELTHYQYLSDVSQRGNSNEFKQCTFSWSNNLILNTFWSEKSSHFVSWFIYYINDINVSLLNKNKIKCSH